MQKILLYRQNKTLETVTVGYKRCYDINHLQFKITVT